jgi:hypothetical protein
MIKEDGEMSGDWFAYLMWILAAAGLSFGISWLFSGRLRWRRKLFLIPYVTLSGALIAGYIIWSEANVVRLVQDNLVWGVIGALVLCAIMIRNVLGQPGAPRAKGVAFAVDLTWSGLIYGSVDSLLLTVLPVLATLGAFGSSFSSDLVTQFEVGIAAMAASIFVAIAYHAGYPEFRGSNMKWAAIGIGMGTMGYLITGNPMTAVASHAAMHMVAVYHGPEGTVQLPPHQDQADVVGL